MCEWKECKLKDVAQNFAMGPFGSNIKAENFQESGVPVIRGKNLNFYKYVDGDFVFLSEEKADQLKSSNCYPDDLVFTHRGTIGQVGIIPEEKFKRYVVSQSGMKLSVNKNSLDKNYLFYFFKSNIGQHELLQNESQVGVPSISSPLTSLKSVTILLPPLPEQRAIASVLSSLDDKIDLLHRQNNTLEAMAETLFRQWFVEKADEGWEKNSITELFEIRDGTHDSPKQKEIGKPLLTSKHILKNRLDIENAYLISEEDFEKVNRRSKVDTNDILFSMIGTIGLIYLEQSPEINYAIKNIGLFKTSQNPDWAYYTFLWLKSSFGQDFIHKHRSGSTQEYISLGNLRSIVFNCPSTELHREFNEIVNSYFNKININNSQIYTLEKLRDMLLPKLISGQIRIDNLKNL